MKTNDISRNELDRRAFLGGALAAVGGFILPTRGWSASSRPDLVFGVISDLHFGAEAGGHGIHMDERVEKALRWFDAQGVDAVMVPGDIAHSGRIKELTRFAEVWYRVFPNGRGSDGRPVEKLFVTGNHDIDAWWNKGDDAWRTANVFNHGDNPAKVWERLFHEPFLPIWKKDVKGYAFVGSQWPSKTSQPPVEAWFREHADELRGTKPFFYVQHAHPKGTCGAGKTTCDHGVSTRALAPFANAVAISGHSHQTLTDESGVWQGSFTSINAGCLREGGNDRRLENYDSTWPFYSKKRNLNRMKPLDGSDGGCGLLVEVYDGRLVVRRRSFVDDLPLGPDWCIALPAAADGAYDPRRQAAASVGPEFRSDDRIVVERCAVTPGEIAGPVLVGKPCVRLRIPHPQTVKPDSRVYDFEIELRVDGAGKLTRRVLAKGFNRPEPLAAQTSDCLFGEDEIPAGGKVTFAVRPRNAFGVAGRALEAELPARAG